MPRCFRYISDRKVHLTPTATKDASGKLAVVAVSHLLAFVHVLGNGLLIRKGPLRAPTILPPNAQLAPAHTATAATAAMSNRIEIALTTNQTHRSFSEASTVPAFTHQILFESLPEVTSYSAQCERSNNHAMPVDRRRKAEEVQSQRPAHRQCIQNKKQQHNVMLVRGRNFIFSYIF